MKFRLILFFLFLLSQIAGHATELSVITMPKEIRQISGTHYDAFLEVGDSVAIIGRISPQTAQQFLAVASKRALRRLVVDSSGGDLSSALLIAYKMRELQMDIYVNGRCFSACANMLLAAGNKKYVLPGSLIGIHEKTVYLAVSNHTLAYSEVSFVGELAVNSLHQAEIAELLKQESAFYKAVQLNTRLLSDYRHFAEQRQLSKLSFREARCKNNRLWILNQRQLSALGINKLEQFWQPENDSEKAMLAKEFDIDGSELFYGEIKQLARYCDTAYTQVPMLNRWLASLFSRSAPQ